MPTREDRTVTSMQDGDFIKIEQTNGGGGEAIISFVNLQNRILERLDETKLLTEDNTKTVTNKTLTAPTLTLINTAVVNAVAATGVLTSDETEVVDGTTITIDTVTYRFKDTPAQAYDVKIVATAEGSVAATLENLKLCINLTGTGTNYFVTGTSAHPKFTAARTNFVLTITAKVKGIINNNLSILQSIGSHVAWGNAETAGGVNGTLGVAGEIRGDLTNSKIWICTATNTIADANWKSATIS